MLFSLYLNMILTVTGLTETEASAILTALPVTAGALAVREVHP